MSLISSVESILFVSSKPLTARKLADLVRADPHDVGEALEALQTAYKERAGGVFLVQNGHEYQFVTAPENAALVQEYLKEETAGELSRPSLETLTIIAYRGPLTKPEIEQIRGVNCTMILRNLLMRGLVLTEDGGGLLGQRYRVTLDFMRFLGVQRIEDLPDYAALRNNTVVADVLAVSAAKEEQTASSPTSLTEPSASTLVV